MPALATSAQNYLHETLGVSTSSHEPWAGLESLPYFLRDAFDFWQLDILGHKVLLALERNPAKPSIGDIRNRLDKLRLVAGQPVVYVTEALASYERKRLIVQKVPFIVPGNQLYLPVLAMDLREYFHQRRKRIHTFSPATQALVLFWLYTGHGLGREGTTPTEMARKLGYTKMTMSRAFREVDGVLDELLVAENTGGAREDTLHGRALWERLQPYWRNPVLRRHYVAAGEGAPTFGLRAGLTALAAYSMLAEPPQATYAVSQSEWKALGQQDVLVLNHPDPQTVAVEVWSYPPNLLAEQGVHTAVDPLSLSLTLRESRDERIAMALEELLGGIQW